MYLLSHFHEGRRPMTVEVVETLEIMCNLIFTQIKEKYHNAWIMKSLSKKEESLSLRIFFIFFPQQFTLWDSLTLLTYILIVFGLGNRPMFKSDCKVQLWLSSPFIHSLLHHVNSQRLLFTEKLSSWLKLTSPPLFPSPVSSKNVGAYVFPDHSRLISE